MPRPLQYRQRPGLDTRIVDGEAFVITPSTIHHLNPVATAIWLAIETPTAHRTILAFLQDLYPAIPSPRLGRDLRAALLSLRRMGIAAGHETAS